jgi:hypothetical protein
MEFNPDHEATEPLLTREAHKKMVRYEIRMFIVAYSVVGLLIVGLVLLGLVTHAILKNAPLVRNAANGCATVCCPPYEETMLIKPGQPR